MEIATVYDRDLRGICCKFSNKLRGLSAICHLQFFKGGHVFPERFVLTLP